MVSGSDPWICKVGQIPLPSQHPQNRMFKRTAVSLCIQGRSERTGGFCIQKYCQREKSLHTGAYRDRKNLILCLSKPESYRRRLWGEAVLSHSQDYYQKRGRRDVWIVKGAGKPVFQYCDHYCKRKAVYPGKTGLQSSCVPKGKGTFWPGQWRCLWDHTGRAGDYQGNDPCICREIPGLPLWTLSGHQQLGRRHHLWL